MQQIVVATGNQGKLKEIQHILNDLPIELVTQKSLGISGAEETGLTFVENAILKARHASVQSGLPAIADDSGLEVDLLNGAPGIYSARYAGADANDEKNNAKLLEDLQPHLNEHPAARFHCVLVLMRHPEDPTPLICQGVWEGYITSAAKGDNGFGYDPLFFVPSEGCTAAQLPAEVKNRISHRGQALAQFMNAMQEPHWRSIFKA